MKKLPNVREEHITTGNNSVFYKECLWQFFVMMSVLETFGIVGMVAAYLPPVLGYGIAISDFPADKLGKNYGDSEMGKDERSSAVEKQSTESKRTDKQVEESFSHWEFLEEYSRLVPENNAYRFLLPFEEPPKRQRRTYSDWD